MSDVLTVGRTNASLHPCFHPLRHAAKAAKAGKTAFLKGRPHQRLELKHVIYCASFGLAIIYGLLGTTDGQIGNFVKPSMHGPWLPFEFNHSVRNCDDTTSHSQTGYIALETLSFSFSVW